MKQDFLKWKNHKIHFLFSILLIITTLHAISGQVAADNTNTATPSPSASLTASTLFTPKIAPIPFFLPLASEFDETKYRVGTSSGTTSNIYFVNETALCFQINEYHNLTLWTHNGNLNASEAVLWFYDGGCIEFTALEDVTLQVYGNVSKVTVQGSRDYPSGEVFTAEVSTGIYVVINSGNRVVISWEIYPEIGLIPIMLIVGLAGVFLFFFGVLLSIYKVQHGEYEWLIWGFVLVLISACLIIAWLWS